MNGMTGELGPAQPARPWSPTHIADTDGYSGGVPEPFPINISPSAATPASSTIETALSGEPETDAFPEASTMSSGAASS